MREKLRVGLLGCGRIAAMVHAPILAARSDVAVAAIADAAPEARDRVGAHAPGAVRFADWSAVLRLAELDAAVICLPPALHAPAAIAAFEAGLHVYVEKPLALDLTEADAMIAAWRAVGTVGMVGFNFRFHPLFDDLRARIAAGDLGALVAVRTLFTSARRTLPGWKADPAAGGGALADLGTHHFDLLDHLTGSRIDPGSLRVEERRGPEGAAATVSARLETGAPVQMLLSQTTGHSSQAVQLFGEKGHLTADVAEHRPRTIESPPGRRARIRRLGERLRALDPRALLAAPGQDPSFGRALAAFVDAARGAPQPRPDLEDGRRALALVEAAERAGAPGAVLRAVG